MAKILVISPHLDDAVLSCGDYINHMVGIGNTVDIITVFSGSVNEKELSFAAQQFHNNCFLLADAMKIRKKEDINAAFFLKTNNYYLDFPECLYRKDDIGNIYPNLKDIYHFENERDQDMLKQVSESLKQSINNYDIILVPLALGNHADHLLVNKAVMRIKTIIKGKVYYYEDVPYTCYYYKNNNVSDWGEKMLSQIIQLSQHDFNQKISAVLYYRSQLNILWSNYKEMLKQLDKLSFKYSDHRAIRLWLEGDGNVNL